MRVLFSLALAVLSIACIGGDEEIQDSTAAYVFPVAKDILISDAGIGPIRLGVPLDSIAKVNPNLELNRTSDGEGVALVEIPLGLDTVIAYTGEENPSAPVDPSRRVISVETMTPGFRTPQLIHPGSFVRDVESVYGKIVRVDKSEIESREYVTFAHQPPRLTFRLDNGSGIFESGSATTTRLMPRARIFSISVRNQ